MSAINSKLKTWLKRRGFRGEGLPGKRMPMRECNGYVEWRGRKYRFCQQIGVVDIGERICTFDRWANSTENTQTIDQFVKDHR